MLTFWLWARYLWRTSVLPFFSNLSGLFSFSLSILSVFLFLFFTILFNSHAEGVPIFVDIVNQPLQSILNCRVDLFTIPEYSRTSFLQNKTGFVANRVDEVFWCTFICSVVFINSSIRIYLPLCRVFCTYWPCLQYVVFRIHLFHPKHLLHPVYWQA